MNELSRKRRGRASRSREDATDPELALTFRELSRHGLNDRILPGDRRIEAADAWNGLRDREEADDVLAH